MIRLEGKRYFKSMFRFLARRRMSRAAAWLLFLSSRRVASRAGGGKRHRALALSLHKPGVLQDIEETFSKADDFEVIRWPEFALSVFAETILSPALNNRHYQTKDPAVEATKAEYRKFLAEIWKHLFAIQPIHAVISPNYGYLVHREFAAAVEEFGTPFIVLHKENLKSSGRLEYWRTVYKEYRGAFSGRKILVYNEAERELQISSGVTEATKIAITGMPRMDRIHNWRNSTNNHADAAERRQVLFFAFDRKDKLPMSNKRREARIENRWGELSWGSLCEKTHAAVAQIAHQRPDIKVVVKTKSNSRHQTEIVEMLTAGGKPLPPNLEIVTGGDPFTLLANSSVIVAFNTTGQLEALAARKPVITPRFDEATEPKTGEFVIDLGDAVEYADSPEQLTRLVCQFVDHSPSFTNELSPNVRRALVEWTGNDDGGAGKRVLEAIRSEIEPKN